MTGPCQEISKYVLIPIAAGDGWKFLVKGGVILASLEEGDEVKSDFDSEGEMMRGTDHVLVGQWIRAVR